MKRFIIAIALTCVFSVSALAGEIPMTVTAPPPPPDETAQPGDIPSTGVTSPGEVPTTGLSVVLTALGLVF
jgi:hypothetical protein